MKLSQGIIEVLNVLLSYKLEMCISIEWLDKLEVW